MAVDGRSDPAELGRKAVEALCASAAALSRAGEFNDGELAEIATARRELGAALREALMGSGDPSDGKRITQPTAFGRTTRWVAGDATARRFVDGLLGAPARRVRGGASETPRR